MSIFHSLALNTLRPRDHWVHQDCFRASLHPRLHPRNHWAGGKGAGAGHAPRGLLRGLIRKGLNGSAACWCAGHAPRDSEGGGFAVQERGQLREGAQCPCSAQSPFSAASSAHKPQHPSLHESSHRYMPSLHDHRYTDLCPLLRLNPVSCTAITRMDPSLLHLWTFSQRMQLATITADTPVKEPPTNSPPPAEGSLALASGRRVLSKCSVDDAQTAGSVMILVKIGSLQGLLCHACLHGLVLCASSALCHARLCHA
jgi:hypothetical protein